MATVTVSSKHQITLPVDIVRKLGIEPGSKLAVELIEDRIIAVPEPADWADYFAGSLKGVYGDTKEEIDRYIAEVRHGYDIGALSDALSLDPKLRAVYEATSVDDARDQEEIARLAGGERGSVDQYLNQL